MKTKPNSITLAAACLVLLCAMPVNLRAATLTVTNTADSGPGTLRAALTNVVNGDTITFSVTGTITLTSGQLNVSNSVTLLGPGSGVLTVSGNKASGVFNVTGTNVTISGLTIANGFADYGAGIYAGGNSGSALAVSGCVLTNNSAGGNGGGIYNNPGVTMTVSNCTVSGNSALNGSGGGLYNGGVLTVIASTLGGNSAAYSGGGIYNNPGVTLTVSNCIIAGNSAANGWGGAICNYQGVLAIVGSTLSGNSAFGGGGGIVNDGTSGSATLTINASTFSGNSADDGVGGGIYNYGSSGSATLTINASTFSGNSAFDGGGIFNVGIYGSATLTINASTFSGNSADDGGGGIYNYGESGSVTLTINASTFSGNSANLGGGIYNPLGLLALGDTILKAGAAGANIRDEFGTITSSGYNLISDNGGDDFLTTTGDQINTDPRLGPLQDNGGPTWTHALLPGSPAIDKGKRDAIPALARTSDQRGLVRPVDFVGVPNATGGDGSDIGACELQPTVVWLNTDDGLGTSSFNSTTNWSDGLPPAAGKNYFNANFLLRTPADGNSYVFGGASLTITSDTALGGQPSDGLLFKGTASSTITVSNLIINGGFLRHANSEAQTFTLAGNLTVGLSGMAVAVQGPLNITAPVLGSGPIKIMAAGSANAARTVEFDSASNLYNGSIELVNATQSRFRLASTAVMNFVIGAGGVNNWIFATPGTGGGVVTFNGVFKFDLTGASTNVNDTWQIVDAAATLTKTYGATFAVNGFCHYLDNTWAKAANGTIYVFNPSAGTLKVTGFRPGCDTDADGLPDDWELACFGNLNQSATGDPDGDGQNNLFEFLAGTNPTNPASAFSLRAATVAGQPNQRNLIFSPWAGGRIYTPQFTTNLNVAFVPLTGYGTTTNGAEVTITDLNATEGQKFYRIQISLP